MNDTKPQIIDFLEKLLDTEFIQVKFAPQSLYESSLKIKSTKYFLDENNNLKALQIQGIELEDISFFDIHNKQFQDLNILNLSFNKITNGKHLSKLKSITALNISNNSIIDIDFISNFKIIKWLNLDNNSINTKKRIPFLSELRKISLQLCNLTSLYIVSSLENLTELNISNNKLKNISGVEKLKKLNILKFNFNHLTNIDQVQLLTDLEILELSNNKLTKFPDISNLKFLTFLDIKNNQIKTIPSFSIENAIIYAHNNPFSNIYLFQNPTTAVLNVNWLAGKVKSIIEEVGNEKGAMLGIFGKWGRGKSYFWEVLKQKLSENQITKYEIVEFIAWKYNDTPATQAYLYESLASAYFKKPQTSNFFQFIKYLLKRFSHNFSRHREKVVWQLVIFLILPVILIYGLSQNTLKIDFINKIFGDFGYFGIIGTYIVYLYYYFTKFNKLNISNILKESSIANFESFLGLQATIEKELQFIFQKWDKKVILFIDDLDRCSEDKILQIIDSLRVITENKYIHQKLTIIAAVDERILRRVIYNKYKPLVESKEQLLSLTREYLEKLFIFGVKLPNLTEKEKEEIFDNYTRNQQLMFGIVKPFISKDYKQNVILDKTNFDVFTNQIIQTDVTPRQIRNIYNRYLLAIEVITELGDLNFETENTLKELIISLVIHFTFKEKPEEIYTNLDQKQENDLIKINVLDKNFEFLKSDWERILFVVEHVVPF